MYGVRGQAQRDTALLPGGKEERRDAAFPPL